MRKRQQELVKLNAEWENKYMRCFPRPLSAPAESGTQLSTWNADQLAEDIAPREEMNRPCGHKGEVSGWVRGHRTAQLPLQPGRVGLRRTALPGWGKQDRSPALPLPVRPGAAPLQTPAGVGGASFCRRPPCRNPAQPPGAGCAVTDLAPLRPPQQPLGRCAWTTGARPPGGPDGQ